jgi:hypothetical protein
MTKADVLYRHTIRHLRNAKEIEISDADGLVGKWVRYVVFGKIRWMQVIGRFYD